MREKFLKYRHYRASWGGISGYVSGYDEERFIMAVDGKGEWGWYLTGIPAERRNRILHIEPSPQGYLFICESNIIGLPVKKFKFGR